MANKRYLVVENPDQTGTVDFISKGVSVEVTISEGKLNVRARMSHGENASTWDEKEVSWDLGFLGPPFPRRRIKTMRKGEKKSS